MVLCYSLHQSLTGTDSRWFYLVSLTILASFFPVRIPFFRGKIQSLTVTISDVFVFTAILLFSPEIGVTVAAVESVMVAITLPNARRLYKILFNLTQLSIVTFIVGHLFYELQGSPAPLRATDLQVPKLFLELGLCALLYFTLNTVAVATAVGLTTKRNILLIWRTDFLSFLLPTFAGASGAAIICIYFDQMPLFAIAVAAPIVLIIHYAYKLNLERIQQAQEHVDQLNALYHSAIASLAMAIDAKDTKTHGHIERVQGLALRLAKEYGIDDEKELDGLRAAALLHDIGKLAIPEYILNKPSALTRWELEIVRKHPTIGADILSSVPFPYPVVPFVRYHHERWDGTGYPERRKGENIPLGARILAIADCYDALRSDRPYRPRLSRQLTIEHITSESGKAYDPSIVKVLIDHLDNLEAEMAEPETVSPHPLSPQQQYISATERQKKEQIDRTVFYEIAATQREIQALYEISGVLGRSLKVSETLALLAEKIGSFVPYTSCAIYLLNSRDSRLEVYHAAGKHGELLETRELQVGEGISGWVAAHKQHLLNVSPAPDFVDSQALHYTFRSCLAMPLCLETDVVGIVSLYSEEAEVYTHDHLRFMQSISLHAAMAIRNAILYEETQEDAYTDVLTGLPNLRYFNVLMDRELRRAARLDEDLTLLMIDLESFKDINDRFGHRIGNRILTGIAQVLRDGLRKSDTCIRYAGDEFIAVLPGVTKDQSAGAIGRLQSAMDRHQIRVDRGESVQVGINIGAATFPHDGQDVDLLLAVADRAMYSDKSDRTQQDREASKILPFEKGAS